MTSKSLPSPAFVDAVTAVSLPEPYGAQALLPHILKAPEIQTPYMLTDLSVVKQNCREFRKNFPSVRLFYAMKAFSDREVISAVDPFVDGYDAASMQEITALLDLGVAPGRVAFSNPVKSEQAIYEAAVRGVNMFAFQSENELQKIAAQAPGAQVYLRVKMDDAHSAVPLSVKYGCRTEDAVDLLTHARSLGLKPIGITFHVGSQQREIHSWGKAIEKGKDLLRAAHAKGLELTLMNIGGGFPARYSEADPSINAVSAILNPILNADPKITYVAEPGRFIVANSSAIVASVIGREERDGRTWLYLDTGLFQAFIGALRYHPFPYTPYTVRHASEDDSTTEIDSYVLSGPSCDSHDVILHDAKLPSDIRVGDVLVFPNTGAYTVVYGSNFNGFPIPPRYFVDGDNQFQKGE